MSTFKEILKHGRNYLTANIAAKALAFISIPVYTRLLTTEEYGIVSIFLSLAGLLASVMAWSMDRSISRYYFDQKSYEDFKQFNGTALVLSVTAFLLNSIIIIVFAENFQDLVGLEKGVIYLLIPFSLINVIRLMFQQIFGPQKKSKLIAKTSLYRVYSGFAFSIIFLLLFSSNKYYGLIYGQILAGSFISIYIIKKITPFFKICFKKEYIKYIFTYSVPLIPYALSGVIISEFGKIAIGSETGFANAGLYTIAQTIGSLVVIMITVTHQAWNPYYYEYMNSKNYKQLDNDFVRIFKITVIIAFLIAAFGEEIGFLLAKKDFTQSLYLIPIFTIGYVFYQLSYTFIRNFGYSKSTQYMTITVLISGISNVLLNSLLIPIYGELGAAISFVGSYFIMFLLAWAINTLIVKIHATSLRSLLPAIIIAIPFYLLLYSTLLIESRLSSIIIRFILFMALAIIILYTERKNLIKILKRV